LLPLFPTWRPPTSTLFPYTPLFRSEQKQQWAQMSGTPISGAAAATLAAQPTPQGAPAAAGPDGGPVASFGAPRPGAASEPRDPRSEEHTSELQSRENLVCRLLLEKK